AAGRALALDPDSTEASDLVTSLIIEPPDVLPPALEQSLAAAEREASRVRARTAIFAFSAVLPLIGVVPFVTVKSWPLLIGFFGSMLGMAFVSWLSYRRGAQVIPISLATTFVTTLFVSRVAGPFVLTPILISGIVLGLAAMPALRARPWIVVAWIVAATVAPVILEAIGWFEQTWWFDGDTLRIRSMIIHGNNRTVETIVMVATHIAFISMSGMFTRAISHDRHAAERRLHIQAWHLRHLLPSRRPSP
ncbi:MAG: hypothetical protein H7138_27075, partial [Myxococcales bacterium]|nr:hypothetical protein [Myxococcales bacterium]